LISLKSVFNSVAADQIKPMTNYNNLISGNLLKATERLPPTGEV
jgi:hypothetical protein